MRIDVVEVLALFYFFSGTRGRKSTGDERQVMGWIVFSACFVFLGGGFYRALRMDTEGLPDLRVSCRTDRSVLPLLPPARSYPRFVIPGHKGKSLS